MRLLGIVFFYLIWNLLPANATEHSNNNDCLDVKRDAIISCLDRRLQTADEQLNKTYTREKIQLSITKRNHLKSVQLLWIEFRDKYCQGIYNEIYPGREADIEKIACLASLTDDRVSELSTGTREILSNSASRVLSALLRAGYDRTELIRLLHNSNESQDATWTRYVKENCSFYNSYEYSDDVICRIRLNLFRGY